MTDEPKSPVEELSESDTEELISSMRAHILEVFERWKNDLAEHVERIRKEVEK